MGSLSPSYQGRALGMVCGAELGGVGRQSLREVGVLGGVFIVCRMRRLSVRG